MGSDAAHRLNSTAICSSTDEDGHKGAMIDVRVTQSHLGLFFPLLAFTPTISAHARVTLEGVSAENNLIPLAVRDPAEERCVEANFYNGSNQIASVPLTKKGTDPNTGAVQWDNASAPVTVNIPSGANVYEQIETGYCGANPSTFDAGSGVLYIDSAPKRAPRGHGPAPCADAGRCVPQWEMHRGQSFEPVLRRHDVWSGNNCPRRICAGDSVWQREHHRHRHKWKRGPGSRQLHEAHCQCSWQPDRRGRRA